MDYVEPQVLPHHLLSNPLLVFAHPATHRVSPRPRTWPPLGPLTTLAGSAPPKHLASRSQLATPTPFRTSATPTQPYVPTKPSPTCAHPHSYAANPTQPHTPATPTHLHTPSFHPRLRPPCHASPDPALVRPYPPLRPAPTPTPSQSPATPAHLHGGVLQGGGAVDLQALQGLVGGPLALNGHHSDVLALVSHQHLVANGDVLAVSVQHNRDAEQQAVL